MTDQMNLKKRIDNRKVKNIIESLVIGECFTFGDYFGEPILWRKLDKNLAITEKILDGIVFNSNLNNKYSKSLLRKWCEDILAKLLNVSQEYVTMLNGDEIKYYFPTETSRQVKPTEWAIMHGVEVDDDGNADWWTISPVPDWSNLAHVVDNFGGFDIRGVCDKGIGVRAVLKF